MGFSAVWDEIHAARSWGKYPKEELVRWAATKLTPNLRVLDLGCGQGSSSWFLAREGHSVTAFDGSLEALIKAERYLQGDGLGAVYTKGCMTKLPFNNNEFDAVVDVVASVHNSLADVRVIWEHQIPRVLKSGGKAFAVMPTPACCKRTFMNTGAISFLSKHDVREILKKHFIKVEILRSTYELDSECTISNWIVSAEKL